MSDAQQSCSTLLLNKVACNKVAYATVSFPSANNRQTNMASSNTDDDKLSVMLCYSLQRCCQPFKRQQKSTINNWPITARRQSEKSPKN